MYGTTKNIKQGMKKTTLKTLKTEAILMQLWTKSNYYDSFKKIVISKRKT